MALFCRLTPLIVVSHCFHKNCDILLVKAGDLEGAEAKLMLFGWSALCPSVEVVALAREKPFRFRGGVTTP